MVNSVRNGPESSLFPRQFPKKGRLAIMNNMNQRPSLRGFERLVADRNLPAAYQTAVQILNAVDDRFGRLERIDLSDIVSDGTDEEIALVFCTRFAAAFGRLISDPGLTFTPVDYERLLLQHRWIDIIFTLSGFRSSDHILPLIASSQAQQPGMMNFEGMGFLRFLATMTLNSNIGVDFEQFWRANRVATALAFLQYISSRYVFQPRAFDFREKLLEWLPGKLSELKLGSLTLARLPEIYMHCSYAITPRKHDIKKGLMQQMRRACIEGGAQEIAPGSVPLPPKGSKPTVVVVAEHFVVGHAVHRTHSRSIASLRERFHVVGAIYPDPKGTPIEGFFDECIEMPMADFITMVTNTANKIREKKPTVVFYLGVGMVPQVIGLASLRLAPIQCVSFGHTATTMSDTMDYFILPEDFVGSRDAFSEKVLALPPAAMPFQPRSFRKLPKPAPDGKVRVAVPASTMKLNPRLFGAMREIVARAKSRAEIQFFPLAGTGLPYFELARVVKSRVPGAIVFPEAPHETYMERLNACDFFLSPFPYGNMNSIIDSFRLDIPGVCLDGPEAHSHADTAFFSRIGLPKELAASTVEEYISAAVRMIDDAAWRKTCQDIVINADLDAAFFQGNASLFCNAIADLIWPPGS
jgi:HMW1-like protein